MDHTKYSIKNNVITVTKTKKYKKNVINVKMMTLSEFRDNSKSENEKIYIKKIYI